jgi:hypothetical protein
MIKKLGIILLVLLFAIPCFGKVRWYNATSHVGGTDGTADSINGQNLFDGDKLIVVTTTNTYFYTLDVDSAVAEDSTSYTVISPDSNAGDKRWVLETVVYDNAFSTFTALDLTPSVANENLLKTADTSTITDFDGGITGQIITVLSKFSTVFDTTTAQDADTNLDGSSADITTATGDITVWLCEDGTTWHLIRFNDASADNS